VVYYELQLLEQLLWFSGGASNGGLECGLVDLTMNGTSQAALAV
jgi:hypothetical protein